MISVQTNTLRTLLANNIQSVVPKSPRHYSWREKPIAELWSDIVAGYESLTIDADDANRKHFLGAFVVTPAGRTEDAIRFDEELLHSLAAARGPRHRDTLLARNNLAAAYRGVGRSDLADRLLGVGDER